MLAVLIERGRADALDLAPGEGGLQHVRGVDRALCAAGAHEGVELVNEEDDIAGAADLSHDGLDALFELTAILRAGDHQGEVKDDDAAVAEDLGDLVSDDELGQALDDRGLADARLTEEHGVVLGAA